MSEFIAPLAFFALLAVVGFVLYDRTRKRLAIMSAYWATRPTALQLTGMCVLVFVVMGLALNALPKRWPEWVRNYIGFGVLAAICWSEWIRRRLWWWRKP